MRQCCFSPVIDPGFDLPIKHGLCDAYDAVGTVVPPFLRGIHSKTPSRCLKLRIMSNHGHATFSPVHISLHGSLWQIQIASTAALALWALQSEIRAA